MKIETGQMQELARANQALVRAADRLLDQAERVRQLRSVNADASDACILLQNMQQSLLGLCSLRRVIRREVRDDFAYSLWQRNGSSPERWTNRLLLRRAAYRQTSCALRLLQDDNSPRA